MAEPTKIDFNHRRISRLSDFTELIEMLFPGNRNQQYAAACMFFELKWADGLVPNLEYIEASYGVTRRVLQRARAKLARVGLIEHVTHLNSRYGGQHGWKLCSKFEVGLGQLTRKCAWLRDPQAGKKENDLMFLSLVEAKARSGLSPHLGPLSGYTATQYADTRRKWK